MVGVNKKLGILLKFYIISNVTHVMVREHNTCYLKFIGKAFKFTEKAIS